jgi:hypothetical protein
MVRLPPLAQWTLLKGGHCNGAAATACAMDPVGRWTLRGGGKPPHTAAKRKTQQVIPIRLAQRIARATVLDGLHKPAIEQVAGLGANGQRPTNMERDWHRFMRNPYGAALEPFPVDALALPAAGGDPEETVVPCIAPHEMAAALFAANALENAVLGNRTGAALISFWRHIQRLPWCPLSPHDPPDQCYPITIHGDCAPCYNGESVLILSWSSPLRAGGSLTSKMVICVVNKNRLVDNRTLNRLLELVAWSVNHMIDNRWPAAPFGNEGDRPYAQPGGTPLTGNLKARWFGLKGDLEFLRWACRWRRHYNANLCCPFCLAHKYHAPMCTSVQPGAAWERTELDHTAIENSGEMAGMPLTAVRGWNHRRQMFDLMHVLPLGLLRILAGGVLVLLGEHPNVYGRGDLGANLRVAYQSWRRWCKNHGISTSVRLFTVGRVGRKTQTSWPSLGAKASNMKRVCYWLQNETAAIVVCHDDLFRTAASCLTELCLFWDALDDADIILTAQETNNAVHHGRAFLLLFNRLCTLSRNSRRFLFHPVPKIHYFAHMLKDLQVDSINMRHVSNFQEEDLMGKIVRIARRCHRGRMSWTVLLRQRTYHAPMQP